MKEETEVFGVRRVRGLPVSVEVCAASGSVHLDIEHKCCVVYKVRVGIRNA